MSSNPIPPNRPTGAFTSIAALFHDESNAEKALIALKREGFTETEIGIATSGRSGSDGHSSFWDRMGRTLNRKITPESSVGIKNSLQASGISEARAGYFDKAVTGGAILISVRASGDRAITAQSILQRTGAELGHDSTAATTPAVATLERDIQLIGEKLEVHKDRVSRGEVRLHKEVIAEKQNVDVPVMHEEVVMERVRADSRSAPRSAIGTEDGELRIPLVEEDAHLEKTPFVTEEIHVSKRQVQETKHLSDTVRHEELRTERQGNLSDAELRDIRDKQRKVA
jgi:uncharacterized protein (TIGR02271 family)